MATRRQVLTAAAHQILRENPEMYRNIANMQDLRREQARRWAQRIVGLNDPGPGAVEQAFMRSDSMNKMLPDLLDTKAKILKPIQDAAATALTDKASLPDTLGRILIANINAEGQTKAAYTGASSDISATALKQAAENLKLKGDLTEAAIGFAAPKDPTKIAQLDEKYRAVLGKTAAGGDSSTKEAVDMLRGLPPEDAVGLLQRAIETKDSAVYNNITSLLNQADKMNPALAYAAEKAAGNKTLRDQATTLGIDMRVSGPEGTTQVDRMQNAIKMGLVVTNPQRGAQLRRTLDAMGDPALIGQLDEAIAQKITPEVQNALDQVDAAIEKASQAKDLVAPSEVREQMRTSEGYVEKAEDYLKQAGIKDSGKLIGLGAAARRAARQQRRGFEKDLDGEGPEAKVETRRLALNKKEALERKNVAGGWSESKNERPSIPLPSDEGTSSRRGRMPPAADEGLPEAPEPAEGAEAAYKPPAAALDERIAESQKAQQAVGREALAAGVAARRSQGVLESLRALSGRKREPEDAESYYVAEDSGPPARPRGYYATRSRLA